METTQERRTYNLSKVSRFLFKSFYIRRLQKQLFFSFTNLLFWTLRTVSSLGNLCWKHFEQERWERAIEWYCKDKICVKKAFKGFLLQINRAFFFLEVRVVWYRLLIVYDANTRAACEILGSQSESMNFLLHIYGGSQRKFGVHANRTSHCKKMVRSFPWTIG